MQIFICYSAVNSLSIVYPTNWHLILWYNLQSPSTFVVRAYLFSLIIHHFPSGYQYHRTSCGFLAMLCLQPGMSACLVFWGAESLMGNSIQGGINHSCSFLIPLRCTPACFLLLYTPAPAHQMIVSYSRLGSYLSVFSLNTEPGPKWAVNKYLLDEWMTEWRQVFCSLFFSLGLLWGSENVT